jgi:two-component system, OmpR family, sensor histidine kinase VicK
MEDNEIIRRIQSEETYHRGKLNPHFENLPGILDAARIGTWSIDVNRKNFCGCEVTKQLLNISRERETTVRNVLKLLSPVYLKRLNHCFFVGYHDLKSISMEIPLGTEQNASVARWIFITGKFWPEIQEFKGIAYEITDKKRIEINTWDLVAKLNHELRTPLSTLRLYTQKSLSIAQAENLTIVSFLKKADRQISGMNDMISDFLSIFMAENQKLTLNKSFFTIKDLIFEMLSDSFISVHNNRIVVTIKEINKIYADKEKLSRVLNNYISNAIKYSSAKSKIHVTSVEINGELKVSVMDFGVGIGPSEQKKLFQKFYRCPSTTGIRGYGIGLYLVKEIIDAHHGRVGVESEYGQGSVFYFCLPIKK